MDNPSSVYWVLGVVHWNEEKDEDIGQEKRGPGHLLPLGFRDLSNNQISEIAPDAFQGLRSLNSL